MNAKVYSVILSAQIQPNTAKLVEANQEFLKAKSGVVQLNLHAVIICKAFLFKYVAKPYIYKYYNLFN